MTAIGPRGTPGVVEVAALGESLVTFLPTRPGRLADVPSFERAIGGARSDVACALAAAGHTARRVSRVGADGFGDHPAAALTVPGGLGTPPGRDHADRLAAPDEAAWGRLRLGPGWTGTAREADEEVRTP